MMAAYRNQRSGKCQHKCVGIRKVIGIQKDRKTNNPQYQLTYRTKKEHKCKKHKQGKNPIPTTTRNNERERVGATDWGG